MVFYQDQKTFQKHLEENGVDLKLANHKSMVKRYITAEFARQLFDEQKYYEIVLKDEDKVHALLK